MIASLVGLYSVPYFARLRPVVRETATIKVSVPCRLEFSPFLELKDIFLVVVKARELYFEVTHSYRVFSPIVVNLGAMQRIIGMIGAWEGGGGGLDNPPILLSRHMFR